MSEDNGQFTTPDSAYGREGLEREAGFVPMPDKAKEEASAAEELTEKEAAAERAKQLSGSESNIVTHVAGADFPDNMTMSPEQAADALSDSREADAEQAKIKAEKALQKEVDELRKADGIAEAPPAAEQEPDIEKVLSHPKVREALDKHVSEHETARQAYSQGVDNAQRLAISGFADAVPELMNIPMQEWESALKTLSTHDPKRYLAVTSKLQAVIKLNQAQHHMKQQSAAREQQAFAKYSAEEDAKVAKMTKGERNMPAIEAEIPSMLKDLGVEPGEFLKMGNESKFLRSAAAQKILIDAAKYRLLMKTPRPVAARADLPGVAKPGIARSSSERGSATLESLNSKLSRTGSIADATKLLLAKRGRR